MVVGDVRWASSPQAPASGRHSFGTRHWAAERPLPASSPAAPRRVQARRLGPWTSALVRLRWASPLLEPVVAEPDGLKGGALDGLRILQMCGVSALRS
jgi:hypothetical protein